MVRSLRIELELVESGTARLPFKRDDGFTLLDQDGIIRLTDELDPTYRTIYPMIKERLGIKDTAHGLRLYVFSPLKPEDAPGRQVVSTDSFDALLATWREEKSEDDGTVRDVMLIYCEEGTTDAWALQRPVAVPKESLADGAEDAAAMQPVAEKPGTSRKKGMKEGDGEEALAEFNKTLTKMGASLKKHYQVPKTPSPELRALLGPALLPGMSIGMITNGVWLKASKEYELLTTLSKEDLWYDEKNREWKIKDGKVFYRVRAVRRPPPQAR